MRNQSDRSRMGRKEFGRRTGAGCPKEVTLFYGMLILWIILLLRYEFTDSEETETVSLPIQNISQADRWEISFSGHTEVPYRKEEAEKIILSISNHLCVQASIKDLIMETKQNGYSLGYTLTGTYWKCKVMYYYLQEIDQGYLTIRMTMNQEEVLCSDYEQVIRKIREWYHLDGMVVVMLEYRTPSMSMAEKEQWQRQFFQKLEAREVNKSTEGKYLFVYGYSDRIPEKLCMADQSINVNIVAFDDTETGESVFYVGFPYLPFDQ